LAYLYPTLYNPLPERLVFTGKTFVGKTLDPTNPLAGNTEETNG